MWFARSPFRSIALTMSYLLENQYEYVRGVWWL
jgi:hypothetical protein